jgi:outer membrane protein OmpA-like peptidoglycan-associated protein
LGSGGAVILSYRRKSVFGEGEIMSSSANAGRRAVIGVTMASCLAILPAHAAGSPAVDSSSSPGAIGVHATARSGRRASREQGIGFLSGLALGAAAGGPIGAVVGAAAGGWLGGRYHHELAANQALSARLRSSEADREQLDERARRLAMTLAASRQRSAALHRTLRLSDELETQVGFRTGAATLTGSNLRAVRRLGELAAALPGVTVHVDGYADPRGPADLNDDLSLLRAEAVALALARAGCPTRRLLIEGHGASASTEAGADPDSYAFDRRVTVRLEKRGAREVASRD